jgi:hypothetical protein
MMMYDPIAKIDDPAASPSSPSVRLTAFDTAVVRKACHAMTSTVPRPTPKMATRSRKGRSRTSEMAVEAGLTPFASRYPSARSENPTDTMMVATILAGPLKPRLFWRVTFMRSSMNPMSPSPTIMKMTSSAATDGGSCPTRLPMK